MWVATLRSGYRDTSRSCMVFSGNTAIDEKDHTTITGTPDKDYPVSSPEDDVKCPEGGNDVVFSYDGVDAISANGGRDT
ncbi:MAG: hypothetical protein ACRD8Z_00900 [Nitrososphaeraceae archaeon]